MPPPQIDVPVITAGDGGAVSVSNLSLHELFEQQARNMLERANIDEEQKQSILVAMACPCCGAGGMSFSVKLKEPGGRSPDGAQRPGKNYDSFYDGS
jgi:hypothetical protein